jgi:hypothetical protein
MNRDMDTDTDMDMNKDPDICEIKNVNTEYQIDPILS